MNLKKLFSMKPGMHNMNLTSKMANKQANKLVFMKMGKFNMNLILKKSKLINQHGDLRNKNNIVKKVRDLRSML